MRRYGALLNNPAAFRLAVASAVGRVGQTATALAILLAVQRASGSFATAGLASGAATALAAVSGIAQGRLIDRLGARSVLGPAMVANLCAACALGYAVSTQSGANELIALAGATGLTLPAIGAITRTLWARVAELSERPVAYALDAVITEVAYVAGPALGSLAVVAFGGSVTIVGTATLTSIGAFGLISSSPARARQCVRRGANPSSLFRALVMPFGIMFAMGVASGAIVVAVTAFATESGERRASGLLLAAWAAGSTLGALAYGVRTWRTSDETRLLVSLFAMCAAFMPLAFAGSTRALAVLLVLAGVPMAPAYTTMFLMIDRRVSRNRLAEAFAWTSSVAPGVGTAIGMIVAGWSIARSTVTTAFVIADVACLLSLGFALLFLRAVRIRTATSVHG